jgi:hypothetical protein
VLFGGAGPYLDDTWEWDGSDWIERLPAHSPPARSYFSMAYDPIRKRTVLFGGRNGGYLTDTWEWDGSDWIEHAPATQMPPLIGHQMAYDPNRQRVILAGGYINGTFISEDTWEWDGVDWTRLAISIASPGRHSAMMAFDPRRSELFVTKGIGVDGVNEYVATDSNALAFRGGLRQACGTGFDSDGDGLVGCADPDCWTHCQPLCPPGTSCVSGAPRCGDGVCNEFLEGCRLCPSDCGTCTPRCGDFHCDASETATSCPGDCAP